MNWLTKQEWYVLGIVAILLATGWLTQMYRAAHPMAGLSGRNGLPTKAVIQPAKP